jgi:hypothetical protein
MIDAEIHEAVMALPPDERRDRTKVNEAVRDGLRLGPLRPAGSADYTAFQRRRSSATPTSPRNEKADRELNRSRPYGCVRLKWQLRTRQVADKVAVSAPPLWLWRLAVVSGLVPSIPVFRSVRD